jgi:hypothetical protein
MSRIVEYAILRATIVETLEFSVAEAIKTGWQPLGGVSESNRYLTQAVVRYATRQDECLHDFEKGRCKWCNYNEALPHYKKMP